MPGFYPHVIVDDETQAQNAATFRHQLPNRGALSGLQMNVRMTNGATNGHGVSILDVVDLIEVMANGNTPLFSLALTEIEKINNTLNKGTFTIIQDEQADAVQQATFFIPFGRFLNDPEYFLPLSRFRDVKLHTTISPNIAAAAGFATGTFTVTIIAHWDERDLNTYRGTFVTKNEEVITTAASGVVVTELPISHPIRYVNIRAYEAAIEEGVDVTALLLQANSRSQRLVDLEWLDAVDWNTYLFDPIDEFYARAFIQDNDTIATRLGRILYANLNHTTANDVAADTFNPVQIDAVVGDTLTFNISTADVTAGAETHVTNATDALAHVFARGVGVGHNVLLPMGELEDPSQWLNAPSLAKLELELTQGGAGGEVRVATQTVQQFTQRQ